MMTTNIGLGCIPGRFLLWSWLNKWKLECSKLLEEFLMLVLLQFVYLSLKLHSNINSLHKESVGLNNYQLNDCSGREL